MVNAILTILISIGFFAGNPQGDDLNKDIPEQEQQNAFNNGGDDFYGPDGDSDGKQEESGGI